MKKETGLTLVELMIVLAIILLFVLLGFLAVFLQIKKARDSQRKEDLEKIRVAFEDYYNDHHCYPPLRLLNNCAGEELKPYLDKIPCDPLNNEPYKSVGGIRSIDNPDCYFWYKIYTLLENENDPSISKVGLGGGGHEIDDDLVNYGISSPNVSVVEVPSSAFICPTGVNGRAVTCHSFPELSCGTDERNNCCAYREIGYIYLVCHEGAGFCCPTAN